MRQMTPGTTNPSPNQDHNSSSHSKSWFYHSIRGPQKSGAASITSTHQRFAEVATQGLIQELQPRSPKALCDLGQALLRLCSVRVEGTAVPGLQFWVGGAGGAAKRLDGLTVWLRIYWQDFSQAWRRSHDGNKEQKTSSKLLQKTSSSAFPWLRFPGPLTHKAHQ